VLILYIFEVKKITREYTRSWCNLVFSPEGFHVTAQAEAQPQRGAQSLGKGKKHTKPRRGDTVLTGVSPPGLGSLNCLTQASRTPLGLRFSLGCYVRALRAKLQQLHVEIILVIFSPQKCPI
jgi:hypothetical protein